MGCPAHVPSPVFSQAETINRGLCYCRHKAKGHRNVQSKRPGGLPRSGRGQDQPHRQQVFYRVCIQNSNITLIVPVKNAQNVGLRRLVSKDKASRILEALKNGTDKPVFVGQNWNRRFRDYIDKMKSPDLKVVAGVLHELLVIGRRKDLSFGERRLKEQAMSLVAGELSEVLGIKEEDLKKALYDLYAPVAPDAGARVAPASGEAGRAHRA